MSWAAGFVLGAIVSPPDAVAATAVMSAMRIPRKIITILEGESLVNDATALVAYRFAVVAVATGAFSLAGASAKLAIVSVGGIAIGLLVGLLMAYVRRRLKDENVDAILSLLTPYLAYLPAEHSGVSGVLAAVTTGLYMSRRLPQITTSRTRIRLYAIWDVLLFILNGLVFILIGLELRHVLERLRDANTENLIRDALLISAAVILLRMAWVFPATYVPRWISPALRRKDPIPPFGHVFLTAWTGMRGIVSLAAALALPMTTRSGEPFPHRDLILFLTFAVIVATLVLQGLTLPAVIKLLKVGDGGREEHHEELRARYEVTQAALARLEALVATGDAPEALVSPVRTEYQRTAAYLRAELGLRAGPDDENPATCENRADVRLQTLQAQHQMLIKLRDENIIPDDVLRKIQSELDLDEARLEA
jgi:CPA1 family monovalent cation:H+ antiporter